MGSNLGRPKVYRRGDRWEQALYTILIQNSRFRDEMKVEILKEVDSSKVKLWGLSYSVRDMVPSGSTILILTNFTI